MTTPALRHAAAEAARRRRLTESGRRVPAVVVAVRATGRLAGSTPLVEVDLETGSAGRREWFTIVEAVPAVRGGRFSPGAVVELLVGACGDGAMIDWSTGDR